MRRHKSLPLSAAAVCLGLTAGLVGPETAKTVREALTKFEKTWHTPKRYGDPVWKAQMEVLVRLAKAGPEAIPVLTDALKNGPPDTRRVAAQALGIVGDAGARPALRRALNDPEPGVRLQAVKALSQLERAELTGPYRRILEQDPRDIVRQAVAFALERDYPPNPAALRMELENYNLARMDTARVGEMAPDFALTDSTGVTHRLSHLRGKKSVVLIFIIGSG